MELSDWFKGFEKGISCLNEEQRASFFSECGKNCVKCGTLQIYQELYEKAMVIWTLSFQKQTNCPELKAKSLKKVLCIICTLWNVPACFTGKDMFPHPYFVSVPSKAFFMSCIHYGKTRLFR